MTMTDRTVRTHSRARKTVEVEAVRDLINGMLQDSAPDKREARIALAIVLADVLMSTGNYRGFRFTDGNNGLTDDSRRSYYG